MDIQEVVGIATASASNSVVEPYPAIMASLFLTLGSREQLDYRRSVSSEGAPVAGVRSFRVGSI
ncbi:hypothetical protein WMF30_40535 [Sorangium sp. So ce134]